LHTVNKEVIFLDVINVLVNAMHSGQSPYLGIWKYFEKNYAYGNIHYVNV